MTSGDPFQLAETVRRLYARAQAAADDSARRRARLDVTRCAVRKEIDPTTEAILRARLGRPGHVPDADS